jgi:hypothetical protein
LPVAVFEADTVRVAEPVPLVWRLRLLGLTETVGPAGETVAVRLIVPEKVDPAVSVSDEVPIAPA